MKFYKNFNEMNIFLFRNMKLIMQEKKGNEKDQLLTKFFEYCKSKNLTKKETLKLFNQACKRHRNLKKYNLELRPQSKK